MGPHRGCGPSPSPAVTALRMAPSVNFRAATPRAIRRSPGEKGPPASRWRERKAGLHRREYEQG